MGVSHTLLPPSITRAILACPWFAQGLYRVFAQDTKNQNKQSHTCACTGFVQGLYKAPKIKTAEPFLSDCGLHRASRQIKTASKGIIRKECQSFTNHGHDKPPPTVFNPLSLWLTLSLNMGVSHTLWPLSITRAILACLWFAQEPKIKKADPLLRACGLHRVQKIKTAEPLLRACGLHRVCTRRQKSKQQINSHCCQLHLQGLHVYGLKKCHLPLPPPRLSEKSRRELKRMYPTTGAATNSQSSLGVLLLLRQSPPYRSICVAHVFFQKRLFQVDL